ncbi:MAG: single-stranded-DNA-specific exonuclease RecJ [Candidatus Kerfeldbacteria bacterium]|nr:single-stranded-DNA-specific exonuclease RecJ [Candidatus Kerfeldbacteria bacterium]
MSRWDWQLRAQPPAVERLSTALPPLVGRILWTRGFRHQQSIREFLHPNYEQLDDPFLYRDLDVAVGRLMQALTDHEQVTIYGDYDADGICATAILVETLTALGGRVNWYLPERRAEGYGLNTAAIDTLAAAGTTVLVAVDCGTTNVEEIEQARQRGLDVMVLDHHLVPPHQPAPLALINPHRPDQTYPFRDHASGGVAFTLARGLLQAAADERPPRHSVPPGWGKSLLDLVAIATVADLMPLVGENRILVHYGLQAFRQTRRPGLRALFTVMGSDLQQVRETTIGYQVAPRLNAAGRLQHAGTALRLLLARQTDEARSLAEELQRINLERQRLTELAVLEAMDQVTRQGSQLGYVAYAPHWSPGILGLIAGRLVERVWRPVVVMTDSGEQVVGSGRSVPGFDLTAHLRSGEHHFQRFGGHAGACGFTLVSKDQRSVFSHWFRESLRSDDEARPKPQRPLFIDTEATLVDLTPDVFDGIERLAPFGVGHERPKIQLSGIRPVEVRTVGNDDHHLRLTGRQAGQLGQFIGFRLGPRKGEIHPNQSVDLVVEPRWDDWQGRRVPQLTIIDFRPGQ